MHSLKILLIGVFILISLNLVSSAEFDLLDTYGLTAKGCENPMGVGYYNNSLYISCDTINEIKIFNLSGNYTGTNYSVVPMSFILSLDFYNSHLYMSGITTTGTQVFEYYPNMTLINNTRITPNASMGNLRGMAVDGTYFYLIDGSYNKIYVYDFYSGQYVNFYNSPSGAITDLTTNGTNIYAVSITDDKIYKYDMFFNKISNSSIAGIDNPSGVSMGDNKLFVTAYSSDSLHILERAVTSNNESEEYIPPNYNDINLVLDGSYTAPNYNNINLVLGGVAAEEHCWTQNGNVLYIPTGCVYQLNSGEHYEI